MEKLQEVYREHPYLVQYAIGSLISLVLWSVYVEGNPKIGGIFRRPDAEGIKRFRLSGVWPLIKYPFQSCHFWHPKNWDLNWVTASQFGALSLLFFMNIDSIRDYTFKAVEEFRK